MKSLKIALLQSFPGDSMESNLDKGLSLCKKAKDMGAHIAVFPEMWSTGYTINEEPKELMKNAIDEKHFFIEQFKDLAMELQMAIAITYLRKSENTAENSISLIDRFGKIILTYSKVHTCDFGEENVLKAGDDFYVADLDVNGNSVKIGCMICYDREFPESARILMLKGAEIVLVPNACPMEINRISQLRARAYENMIGIATVNYPAGHPDCNGHSTAFDGMAYNPDSRDTLILDAGEDEGIFVAEFPIASMRRYRTHEVHGNAYRRPEKYVSLLSQTIEEPFIRLNRRK